MPWLHLDMQSFEIGAAAPRTTWHKRAKYFKMKLANSLVDLSRTGQTRKVAWDTKTRMGHIHLLVSRLFVTHESGFQETNRLGPSEKDRKYGFLTMYHCDSDNIHQKGSSEMNKREMSKCTIRCAGCHWYKSILCEDMKSYQYIPQNATCLVVDESNSDDPATYVTQQDDYNTLFNQYGKYVIFYHWEMLIPMNLGNR